MISKGDEMTPQMKPYPINMFQSGKFRGVWTVHITHAQVQAKSMSFGILDNTCCTNNYTVIFSDTQCEQLRLIWLQLRPVPGQPFFELR